MYQTAPAPEGTRSWMGPRVGGGRRQSQYTAEWRPGESGLVQETHVWLPVILCQGLIQTKVHLEIWVVMI